jgi:hypothetical protein
MLHVHVFAPCFEPDLDTFGHYKLAMIIFKRMIRMQINFKVLLQHLAQKKVRLRSNSYSLYLFYEKLTKTKIWQMSC